jgi:hypothetical protein
MRGSPDREARMFVFASLVLSAALALAPLDASAALDSPHRHVRSQDQSVRHLLKHGFTHSLTFRTLIARLEQSDVIVYVQEVAHLPGAIDGRMMMLPTAHGQRYVRIQIVTHGGLDDDTALIAHELRHAIEVAEDTGVHDQATLTALYRRIGTGGHDVYDTIAAQETGRTVRRELLT